MPFFTGLKYKIRFIEYLGEFLLQKEPNKKENIKNLVLDLLNASYNPPKTPLGFKCSSNNDLYDDGPLSSSYIRNLLNSEGKNNNKLTHVEKSPNCSPLHLACASDLESVRHLLEQSKDNNNNTNAIEQSQQDQGENVSELLENDFYGFLYGHNNSHQEIIDVLMYGTNITMPTDFQNCSREDQDSNIDFEQLFYDPNEETDMNAQPSMPTNLENGQDQQVQNDGNENIENAQSNGSVVNEYKSDIDSQQQDDEDTICNILHFFS